MHRSGVKAKGHNFHSDSQHQRTQNSEVSGGTNPPPLIQEESRLIIEPRPSSPSLGKRTWYLESRFSSFKAALSRCFSCIESERGINNVEDFQEHFSVAIELRRSRFGIENEARIHPTLQQRAAQKVNYF